MLKNIFLASGKDHACVADREREKWTAMCLNRIRTRTMASKSKSVKISSLTIRNAAKMGKKGRRDVANWLRKQANHLLTDGDNYSARFTASFNYVEGK